MANIIYNEFLRGLATGEYTWDGNTAYKALLVKSNSPNPEYVPNPDDDTLQDLFDGGMVEIENYTRPFLENVHVVKNLTTDKVAFHCNNLNFGNIPAGQNIVAVVIYAPLIEYSGGTTSAPEDDEVSVPVAFFDTVTGLPMSTGGGTISLSIGVNGLFQLYKG